MMGIRLAATLVLCLVAGTATAAQNEDIARAEREYELRKTARALFDRADNRAKEAVRGSSAGEDLREKVKKTFEDCIAEGNALTEAGKDRKTPLDERQALLAQAQHVLLSCADRVAKVSSANDDLIAKLREEFIAEEVELLRDDMDDEDLALLESAVRQVARP